MTPPAKGRPRQPEPREVRADGQAGALPPHKKINGRRQTSITKNAHHNSPPPNLLHHLRQRVMDTNPIMNYHLGDDISANTTQFNTKPPAQNRDIIRNHSPSQRRNSEGKETNRSANTTKGGKANSQTINAISSSSIIPQVQSTTSPQCAKRRRDGHRGANHDLKKQKGNKSKQGAVGNKLFLQNDGSRDWITSKGAGSVIAAPQRVHFYLK